MMAFGTFLSSGFASIAPLYFPNRRLINIDKQIIGMPQKDKDILMYRYIFKCSYDDVAHYIGKYKSYVQYQLERIENGLKLP